MQLRDNVRRLGRQLGLVIQSQAGARTFQQIEDIRRASVTWHRDGSAAAATKLQLVLSRLTAAESVTFAHSFALFLQMTNLAEDLAMRDKFGASGGRAFWRARRAVCKPPERSGKTFFPPWTRWRSRR